MMRLVLALSINVGLLSLFFITQAHMALGITLGISVLVWFFYFLWRRQNLVEQRVKDKISGQTVVMPIEHIMFRAL